MLQSPHAIIKGFWFKNKFKKFFIQEKGCFFCVRFRGFQNLSGSLITCLQSALSTCDLFFHQTKIQLCFKDAIKPKKSMAGDAVFILGSINRFPECTLISLIASLSLKNLNALSVAQ